MSDNKEIRFGYNKTVKENERVILNLYLTNRLTIVVETLTLNGMSQLEFSTEFLVDKGVIDLDKLKSIL